MKVYETTALFTVLLIASCQQYKAAAVSRAPETPRHRREATVVRSPDGTLEAFVCGTPDDLVESEAGGFWVDGQYVGQEATQIWIADVASGQARLLVHGSEGYCMFHELAFAPDGRQLYFLSSHVATSQAVNRVDLDSGQRTFICPGNSVEVVQRAGDYCGNLIVSQHRYFIGGGSYDWHWMFTPEGERVGPVQMDADGEISDWFRRQYLKM